MVPILVLLTFAGGSALDSKPGYVSTRVFPAVHATQAAAATETVFYAVSNRTIATHDRKTGTLVRESVGPAEHLNSALIHDGKVYCAHSNYPAKPDTSEIRVYDPATNKLAVWRDFPNPPGSLVWCLVKNNEWWCCFAHYGKDNAKTVLIHYAEGFREKRRYTFPATVVADWDAMSASGGVWDGETLLVSHHHYPVLYRMRVPAKGAALELVEVLKCPFAGQGIAADPATGGLVGIDRTKRAVVFAGRE